MGNNQKHHLLPSDAELVFDGVRSRVYQWDQELYDGSVARFERICYIDGAFVIPILSNGRILLTKQEQPLRPPFFSLPGGAIDPGDDSPLSGALRELREETGYEAGQCVLWKTFDTSPHILSSVHIFIAHNLQLVGAIDPDPGEKIDLFDVTFDEFLALSSDPRFQHHTNLLPILYEARLSRKKYRVLYDEWYHLSFLN